MIDPGIYSGIERARAKVKGVSIQDHVLELVKEAAVFIAEKRWAKGHQRGGYDADILLLQTAVRQTVAMFEELTSSDLDKAMFDAVYAHHVAELKLVTSGGQL